MSVVPLQQRTDSKTAPTYSERAFHFVERTFKYWALIPLVVVIILLMAFPVLNLLRMSVSEIEFMRGEVIWRTVGLAHLNTFLKDWVVRIVFVNTLVFVACAVSIEMLLGFFLALVCSRVTSNVGLYRTILVIPILVPAIAIGSMWRLLYNTDFGLINQIIRALGGQSIPFLASTAYAMPSVILVDVWHWVPFVFLICLAGFESLPQETLEAASVDGAADWKMLRYIVLPLMAPTLIVTLLFRTINAFKVFDQIFLLTSGGPSTATEVISLYINNVFFQQNRLGYGAFVSVITIALVVGIILLLRRLRTPGSGE